jgi:polyhydroxybutyrate depolymerase
MAQKSMVSYVVSMFLLLLVTAGCGANVESGTSTLREPTSTQSEVRASEASASQEPELESHPTPPSGVTSAASPLHIESGGFAFEGHEREYLLFIPDSYTEGKQYPLVVYLHSYGWNARRGMEYTHLNEVGNANGFFIVYPNGIDNWNSGIGDNSAYPTKDVDDVGFIDALIDTLSSSYGIDLERVYATGYSNGGFMTYRLACELSQRIAAIASVGGVLSTSVLADCNPDRAVPVLQIHGTRDPWVPLNGATGWHSLDETLNFWVNWNNCIQHATTVLPDLDPTDECTAEKTQYTDCTDNSHVIYYEVINGGHSWPGAGSAGYYVGNTNQDFSASVEIWNFFKDYRLSTNGASFDE